MGERQRRTIAAFLPMAGEPDLNPLLTTLLVKGFAIAVPEFMSSDPPSMRFLAIDDPRMMATTTPSLLGTRIPTIAREASVEEFRCLMVPGVAFDGKGRRLGRGKGYFDEFLRRTPLSVPRVGVAFEVQVVDEVPIAPHDETVDWLCTERGLRRTA